MIKYKKIFKDFWGYSNDEYVSCVGCTGSAVDIHHLIFKSHGGRDTVENLVPLCRECHQKAHDNKAFNQFLIDAHQDNLNRITKDKS